MIPIPLLALVAPALCLKAFDNGVGHTPQMGWNSWNKYGCNINESVIISAAETMNQLGLLQYGYEYIVMDDCYQLKERDSETGKIVVDPQRFPNGIKYLSDRVHQLGFKFGMYSSAGKFTCGRYPGSLGYEELDAQTFADWGVDYLKYDNCFNEGMSGNEKISSDRYLKMSQALNATGRTIFYSLCQWGEDNVWNWGTTLSNSWRVTGDIYDSFNRYDDRCPCESFDCAGIQGNSCSMVNIFEKAIPLAQKSGPFEGWNDLDSLEVGNGGMTTNEYKAHFTLWAILKSPLVLGNDLPRMSQTDFAIITNKDIIAINQDFSSPAVRVWKRAVKGGHLSLLVNKLADPYVFTVTLFNSGDRKERLEVKFSDIFFDHPGFQESSFTARDLWTNETMDVKQRFFTAVNKHSVKVWNFVLTDTVAANSGWGANLRSIWHLCVDTILVSKQIS